MKIDLSNEEIEYIRGAVEDICATAHERCYDETGCRILDKLPQTYSIGDRFRCEDTGEECMLVAAMPGRVNMVNMDGEIMGSLAEVQSTRNITQSEFDRITRGDGFKKI